MTKIIYYTPKVVVTYCFKGHDVKVQRLSMYTCLVLTYTANIHVRRTLEVGENVIVKEINSIS